MVVHVFLVIPKLIRQFIESLGIQPTLIEATEHYNDLHVEYQVQRLLAANQTTDSLTFENVCYKDNCLVPIIEESAKLKMACQLVKLGKKVIIKDYAHILDQVKLHYGQMFDYEIKTDNL